jgi:hypothetical protein
LNGRVDFPLDDLTPTPRDVLGAQGIPPGAPVSHRIGAMVDMAIDVFRSSAEPVGIIQEVDAGQLSGIVDGPGLNAPDPVVDLVSARGRGFALFAATVGAPVSDHISNLLAGGNFALGAALDATASVAADRCSEILGGVFLEALGARGASTATHHVLGYSPGYCGWHLSGQRKLFDYLGPERIGISLSRQFLMTPLKSVSGVLVSGPTPVHDFQAAFSYCPGCRSRSCQARIRGLHALDGEES